MGAVKGIQDVAERHLCAGCGACAYLQPRDIRMVDDYDAGRRPLVTAGRDTREALSACPGARLEAEPPPAGSLPELLRGWGPVLSVWEGFAVDDEVRWLASSGGAATALALHGLAEGMHGVLHIRARPDAPFLNETVLSRERGQLLAATGSRYAPASPCDGLGLIEQAAGPCVMIGKPCDVAGAVQSARLRPGLRDKLGLTIAIFCAGTPSTRGTMELAARMGFSDPRDIARVRYRGKGWPGEMEIEGQDRLARMSYAESWDFLQRYRQWRCYTCADHTGEFADISVGDPWYREFPEGEPGRSLVLARTTRGAAFLERALAAGALRLERAEPRILPDSQQNLLHTRGAVWARSVVLRSFGIPAPRYEGLATFSIWLRHLTWKQRLQSLYGTVRRVLTKRLLVRTPVVPWTPPDET